MHPRSLLAVTLAAAIAMSAPAPAMAANLSDVSRNVAGSLVLSPVIILSLAVVGSATLSNAFDGSTRWKVTSVRPKGKKTAVELCDDRQAKIEVELDSRVAHEQNVRVDDELGIEALGKSGYALKKGAATIALLAQPGNGMHHSKARG